MATNHRNSRHSITRRSFLKIFSASLTAGYLAACTGKKFLNHNQDILLSGGSFNKDKAIQNALVVINLTQKEKRVITTPFLPHGIQVNPNNIYSIICFEKNGVNACEINLQTQSVTRIFQTEQNQLFSGHASFSADGKTIYCIEVNNENQQGIISIRRTDTFETIKQLPTLGLSPHDCQLTTDNILTVSNSGKSASGFHQPSLVSIDLNTEKLVERIKLDIDDLNCGHFKFTADSDLVIASAPITSHSVANDNTLSGGVSIRKQNDSVTTMTEPDVIIARMTGEALNIEVDQQQSIAAITHPAANLLSFWSIKDKRLISTLDIENPRGLSQALDGKDFIVSYGKKPAMTSISISDLSPRRNAKMEATLASGEHIINWSKSVTR